MSIKRKVKKVEGIKPIPADIYPAKLVSITESDGNWGKYFKLEFEIVDGAYAGEKRSILAKDNLVRGKKGNSKIVDILQTLSGTQLNFDQEVDVEDYLGKKARIVLEEPKTVGDILVQNIGNVMTPKE